jgi:hypothetical protein
MNRRQPHNRQHHSKLTPKWILILIGLAVLYMLLQPLANRQLGWNLPSLVSLLPDQVVNQPNAGEPNVGDSDVGPRSPRDANKASKQLPQASNTKPSSTSTEKRPSENTSAPQPPLPDVNLLPTASKPPSKRANDNADNNEIADNQVLLHGLLRQLGREEYASPAGLRYTSGSAEGHRLQHLARHLEDQPDRSGRHGVFAGDMEQFLKSIDLTYTRANERKPRTSMKREDERTIYEMTFDQPIGYIGGREGARLKRPRTDKLRLVTEQDRVITAFPY